MSIKQLFVTASALTAFMAGFAFAQQHPSFDEVDADGDGELSKSEADQAFPALGIPDLEGNGMITRGEVKAVLPDIDFEENDTTVVDSSDYDEIVSHMEERDSFSDRAGDPASDRAADPASNPGSDRDDF